MFALPGPGITELAVRIGWTLIHFLWQGAVIGLIYAGLRIHLRQGTAQARYLLGVFALAVMACMPFATFLWLGPSPEPSFMPAPHHSADIKLVLSGLRSTPSSDWLNILVRWITYAWAAGVTIFSLRLTHAWTATLKLRADAVIGQPIAWRRLFSRLCIEFGVRRNVVLALSNQIVSPAVIGWIKPVILIPPSMLLGLSTNQVEMILLHELSHIRRHDYLINTLQMILETVLFYHPVIHWISRQTRAEREYCCDDLVLGFCGDRAGYLKALTALETSRNEWTSVMAANGGSLLRRAQRIAQPQHEHRLTIWPLMLTVSVLLAGSYSLHLGLGADDTPQHASAAVNLPRVPESRNQIPESSSQHSLVQNDHARMIPVALRSTNIELPAPVAVRAANLAVPDPIKPLRVGAISSPPNPVSENAGVVAGVSTPMPGYPYQELRADMPGTVDMSFKVTREGRVADIATQVTQGAAAFSDVARDAVARWKFRPVRIDGRSMSSHVTLTMVFTPVAKNQSGVCVHLTGSQICRHVEIKVKNLKARTKYDEISLVAENDAQGHTFVSAEDTSCNTSRLYKGHSRFDYQPDCAPGLRQRLQRDQDQARLLSAPRLGNG